MESKKYNVFIIAVSALVVLNCVLLGIYWFKRVDHPPLGVPVKPNEYLIRELDMTPAQIRTYDTLRTQHFSFTSGINCESRQLRDDFFKNIKTQKLDTVKAFAIERRLTTLQFMLDTVTLNHFRKVRAILTSEQKIKFDRIIQNALRMMGQQRRPMRRDDAPNGTPPTGGARDPEQGPLEN